MNVPLPFSVSPSSLLHTYPISPSPPPLPCCPSAGVFLHMSLVLLQDSLKVCFVLFCFFLAAVACLGVKCPGTILIVTATISIKNNWIVSCKSLSALKKKIKKYSNGSFVLFFWGGVLFGYNIYFYIFLVRHLVTWTCFSASIWSWKQLVLLFSLWLSKGNE